MSLENATYNTTSKIVKTEQSKGSEISRDGGNLDTDKGENVRITINNMRTTCTTYITQLKHWVAQ